MEITLNWQLLITVVAVIGAAVAIYKYFSAVVHWVDNQKKQDEEITAIKEENQLHTYALLACLKGLVESGCDGPCRDGIDRIEKYLNKHAHD